MLERLLIAGAGGQGIVLIGRLLATVAVRHFEHVTFFPAYGAEVRGGSSSCQVVLSEDQISSPLAEEFDSMIIMNQASAERFRKEMRQDCMVLHNTPAQAAPVASAVTALDATAMALDLGDVRVANFIMLGAFLARKPLVPPVQIEDEIRRVLSARHRALVELNIRAFLTGLELLPAR